MADMRLSDDGLYYWDGSRWISTLSPDGRWRWNGSGWVPADAMDETDAVRRRGVVRGVGPIRIEHSLLDVRNHVADDQPVDPEIDRSEPRGIPTAGGGGLEHHDDDVRSPVGRSNFRGRVRRRRHHRGAGSMDVDVLCRPRAPGS